jgi:selenocysteine lyase/cysteine desulfurase
MSDVKEYMIWLGKKITEDIDAQVQIKAAGAAIQDYEKKMTDAMLYGVDNLKGLNDFDEIEIIGGADNPSREGLVSFRYKGQPSEAIVRYLNQQAIRTHTRKCDHYSSNILAPLGWDDCIRVSICHYNTVNEVKKFLSSIATYADK